MTNINQQNGETNPVIIFVVVLGFIILLIGIALLAYAFTPNEDESIYPEEPPMIQYPLEIEQEYVPEPLVEDDFDEPQTMINSSTVTSLPSVGFNTSRMSLLEYPGTAGVIIKLSEKSSENISLDYSILESTVTKGVDYNIISGDNVTIPAGQEYGYIRIQILTDEISEPEESMILELSNPVNATLTENEYGVAPMSSGYRVLVVFRDDDGDNTNVNSPSIPE